MLLDTAVVDFEPHNHLKMMLSTTLNSYILNHHFVSSLEREEAEDLIKRHGGRVTGSISKKTSYLLADEDVGGKKSQKAKELGTPFLTEDGLFDILRASKPPAGKSSKAAIDALPNEVAETVRAGEGHRRL